MPIILGLLVFASASVILLVRELRKAPEGYEDQTGFHVVDKTVTKFNTSFFKAPAETSGGRKTASNTETRATKARRGLDSVASHA